MAKKKSKPIKELKKEAWKWMSRYTRVRAADDNGYVICVTSGKCIPWKESQAGHFVHATKGNWITYDARNINVQSPFDNYSATSRVRESYEVYIETNFGIGTILELNQIKAQSPIMKTQDYEEVIEKNKTLALKIAKEKRLQASWIK